MTKLEHSVVYKEQEFEESALGYKYQERCQFRSYGRYSDWI